METKMNIQYTLNPLNSIITLDDKDKEILLLKIKVELLEDKLLMAQYYLRPNVKQDVDKAYDLLELYAEDGDTHLIDKRANELLGFYVDSLQDSHCGDCICFPCSCTKCHAERMLGVDTIAGLGKYAGHFISYAFSQYDKNSVTLFTPQEVLARLKKFANQNEAHAKAALSWLENYYETHFPNERI